MPIARVQLPDGKIGRFEVPEGAAPQEIEHFVSQQFPRSDQKSEIKQPEIAPQQSKSAIESAFDRPTNPLYYAKKLGQAALGVPDGLGNLAVGATQLATDVVNPSGDSNFSKNLVTEVKSRNQQQSKLPIATRAGIMAAETAPFLTSGVGAAKKIAELTGSELLGLLLGTGIGGGEAAAVLPEEQSGINNKAKQTLLGAAESTVTAGLLKGGSSLISKAVDIANPIANQVIAKATPIRSIREDFAHRQAISKLKTGLKKEGADAGVLLDQMEKEGVDLIDAVDPRFRIASEATKSLNRRGSIQIVDESLSKLNDNADKLQNSVFDMVSTNKITPEKAGEILGRNSQKILNQALELRRAKAGPLYKSGLASGTKIPLETKLGKSTPEAKDLLGVSGEGELTLGQLLKSPVVQNAIKGARNKSSEFANSPAEEIYGKIHEKSKVSIPGYGSIGSQKEQYKIPDNDVRVLHALDNILYDRINEVKITGANKEQTALSLVRNRVSNLLDNANSDLRKARKYYKADTQAIISEGNSLVGKFAKFYKEGKKDQLTKSAMDILKFPPNRIIQAKAENPQEFNDLLRTSLENRIASVTPVDDSPINPKAFNRALFGKDGGESLKAALGDDKSFQGMKKLADVLDVRFQRNRISKNAIETVSKGSKIPTGKFTLLNRAFEGSYNAIANNPMAQKKFVEFVFTPKGKQALKEIAKSKNIKEQLILSDNFIQAAGITAASQNN